jgi:hypothetical protein
MPIERSTVWENPVKQSSCADPPPSAKPVPQGHDDSGGECTRCPAKAKRRFVFVQGAREMRLCWECASWLRAAYGLEG